MFKIHSILAYSNIKNTLNSLQIIFVLPFKTSTERTSLRKIIYDRMRGSDRLVELIYRIKITKITKMKCHYSWKLKNLAFRDILHLLQCCIEKARGKAWGTHWDLWCVAGILTCSERCSVYCVVSPRRPQPTPRSSPSPRSPWSATSPSATRSTRRHSASSPAQSDSSWPSGLWP